MITGVNFGTTKDYSLVGFHILFDDVVNTFMLFFKSDVNFYRDFQELNRLNANSAITRR